MHFEQSKRLNNTEAQIEANMVRANLAEVVGHEPTVVDYQSALEAVEEMKRLASEEPNFDKIVFEIFRIGNKYINGAADGLLWILTLGKRPGEQDKDNREWHLHQFEDASVRLRRLKQR